MAAPGSDPASWTLTSYPEFIQPHIGYLFWRLQSGASLDRAVQDLTLQRDLARLTPEQYGQVSSITLNLLAAAEQARAEPVPDPRVTLEDTFAAPLPQGSRLGVRVTLTITTTYGMERDVSILVNAGPGVTLLDILQRASAWAEGNAADLWGSEYEVHSVDASSISQISGIPWDSAILQL